MMAPRCFTFQLNICIISFCHIYLINWLLYLHQNDRIMNLSNSGAIIQKVYQVISWLEILEEKILCIRHQKLISRRFVQNERNFIANSMKWCVRDSISIKTIEWLIRTPRDSLNSFDWVYFFLKKSSKLTKNWNKNITEIPLFCESLISCKSFLVLYQSKKSLIVTR